MYFKQCKRKISIFTQIFIISNALPTSLNSVFLWYHSPSFWETSFSISCRARQLVTNSLNFLLFEMSLFCPNSQKIFWLDIKFWVKSDLFRFWHFKSIFHCHLAFMVSDKKHGIFQIILLYVIWHFPLVALKIFLLSQIFSSLTKTCSSMVFFLFTLFRTCWDYRTFKCMSFIKIWEVFSPLGGLDC